MSYSCLIPHEMLKNCSGFWPSYHVLFVQDLKEGFERYGFRFRVFSCLEYI
jgi:hypothetical protein